MNGSTVSTGSAARSLLPQEHGAWGQLAMPILSGLALARPTASAALLAAATVLAFLAHEPWLVAIGHRGERARLQDGRRAVRAMLGLLASAAVAAVGGLWLAPPAIRLAALVPAALGAGVVLMVLRERERTIPGELTVTTALASAGGLVALASGASSVAAATLFLVWALAFADTVFAVQTVLLRTRARGERDAGVLHASAVLAVSVGGSAMATAAGLGNVVALALAPTAAVCLWVCLARPPATRLRLLGWALVGATTASLLTLIVLRPA